MSVTRESVAADLADVILWGILIYLLWSWYQTDCLNPVKKVFHV